MKVTVCCGHCNLCVHLMTYKKLSFTTVVRVGVTDSIDAKVEHLSLERLYNSHLQSAVDNALRSTDGIPIRAMEKDLKAREATINSMTSLIGAKDLTVRLCFSIVYMSSVMNFPLELKPIRLTIVVWEPQNDVRETQN